MEKESLTEAQTAVRAALRAQAEPKYAEFSGALVPDHAPMLGVRIPAIRKLAKTLDDYRAPADAYFEELMTEGIVIGLGKDYPTWEARVRAFLPRVRDWSVNDCMLATCKLLSKHLDEAAPFLFGLTESEETFYARFGVVALMDYYLVPEWAERALAAVTACRNESYYARMGVAWCLATALAKFPDLTLAALSAAKPDAQTCKLLRSKAAQSYRVDAGTLERLKETLA